MNKTDALVDWIHRVEFDLKNNRPTKRLHSIVSEIYFEEKICSMAGLRVLDGVATGWMKCYNPSKKVRQWYKLSSNDCGNQIEASKTLVHWLAATRSPPEFFLVDYAVSYVEGIPIIDFNLRQFSMQSGVIKWLTEPLDEQINTINREITLKLSELINLQTGLEIEPWLRHLPTRKLEKLFATRCWMNYSKLYLSDIDGVALDSSKSLVFLEFKRKDPAMGYRYRLSDLASKRTYLRMAQKLNKAAADENVLEYKKLTEELDNGWEQPKDLCFGLDTTHADNVFLCQEIRSTYRYIVWNQSPAPLSQLLDVQLNPLGSPNFLYLDVLPSHFDGISKADGEKSGSYSEGLNRHQLMLLVDDFNSFN